MGSVASRVRCEGYLLRAARAGARLLQLPVMSDCKVRFVGVKMRKRMLWNARESL